MADTVQEQNREKLKTIPGYRQADVSTERCDTCKFGSYPGSSNQEFNRTQRFCKMFRAYVASYYVCDEWEQRSKKRYYVKR